MFVGKELSEEARQGAEMRPTGVAMVRGPKGAAALSTASEYRIRLSGKGL